MPDSCLLRDGVPFPSAPADELRRLHSSQPASQPVVPSVGCSAVEASAPVDSDCGGASSANQQLRRWRRAGQNDKQQQVELLKGAAAAAAADSAGAPAAANVWRR